MQLTCAIIGHLVGDYLLQNDWMALEKGDTAVRCSLHTLDAGGLRLFRLVVAVGCSRAVAFTLRSGPDSNHCLVDAAIMEGSIQIRRGYGSVVADRRG